MVVAHHLNSSAHDAAPPLVLLAATDGHPKGGVPRSDVLSQECSHDT